MQHDDCPHCAALKLRLSSLQHERDAVVDRLNALERRIALQGYVPERDCKPIDKYFGEK